MLKWNGFVAYWTVRYCLRMATFLDGVLPENIDSIDVAVFDVDGTLSCDDASVSDRTIDALRKLADTGVEIVFASGRMAPALRKLFSRMDRSGYVIACNGAITVHTDHDTIIGLSPFSDEYFHEIVEFGRQENLQGVIFGTDFFYTETDGIARQLLKAPNEGLTPTLMENLEDLDKENRLKVMYYIDSEDTTGMVAHLRNKFPDTVKTLPEFYELTNHNTSKWTGLTPVLEDLGTTPERTLGIGDSENDMSWLPNVGISVAMGNAYPHVKEACDYEIGQNEDDAVATFLTLWAEHRRKQQNA